MRLHARSAMRLRDIVILFVCSSVSRDPAPIQAQVR